MGLLYFQKAPCEAYACDLHAKGGRPFGQCFTWAADSGGRKPDEWSFHARQVVYMHMQAIINFDIITSVSGGITVL